MNNLAEANVDFGFASFADGRFELIVRDRKTWEETTLMGALEPGQFEVADRILPTCVFVEGAPRPLDSCIHLAAKVLWDELCPGIRQTEADVKHYVLAVRQMLSTMGLRQESSPVGRASE
jgi:hypothetical protein